MPILRCTFLVGALLSGAEASRAVEQGTLVQKCRAQGKVLLDNVGAPQILTGTGLASKAVACAAPKFPELARQARIEGQVFVGVLVDQTGKVKCVHLVGGHPLLATSADAARQWKFRPEMLKGSRVSFYGILAFHFSTSGAAKSSDLCLEAAW